MMSSTTTNNMVEEETMAGKFYENILSKVNIIYIIYLYGFCFE